MNKHKSKVPKNYLISNVKSNMNQLMVTKRQSRLNKTSLVCYTSQLEPKSMEKALGDES